MHDVSLAFVWHQHQPYYPDDVGQENPMPWVRLHATKDYWGMAMHLKEVPELAATVNLVPSLLVQLSAYAEQGHEDAHLRLSRLAADELTEEDTHALLDTFFMANPDQMIRPHARYQQLYQKRGFGIDSAARAAKRFTKQDLLDLQCWSNLAWLHEIAFERDRELAEFRTKGRGWTEKEKLWLLERQLELLRQVIPLHKELAARGQIELTTTPFYHPILPLLWDKSLARAAMPDVRLPTQLQSLALDGQAQIERAVAYHERTFGQRPRGMWPSEGSVCQGMIPAIAAAGIRWIATDEEILSCSTDGWVARDSQGYLRNPELLYRPWRVEEKGHALAIVFRDHAMSDQIGFHYQRYAPEQAVDDFVGKIEAIGRATTANAPHRPTLVSIILDGENCWEYYPRGGVDFLRQLYRRIAKHPKITPVRVGDYLEQHPATDRLTHLFPGSWIRHNFGIWIGHSECNAAWDAVAETRAHLEQVAHESSKPAEPIKQAWEELYIAEGSDWFWWFGDEHSSAQDSLFDRLFRKHLQNVYLILGETPPHGLAKPISEDHVSRRLHTQPSGLLKVKVDGRRSYFEWINAGHYVASRGRGTMAMSDDALFAELHFGFDTERLLVRLDAHRGTARERLADVDRLRLRFFQPEGFELMVTNPAQDEPIAQLFHDDVLVSEPHVEVAAERIVELAIPFRSLAVSTDDAVQFCIELLRQEQPLERIPREGAVESTVPSSEFEQIMWQA